MKTITLMVMVFIVPFTVSAQLQNNSFEEWINPVGEDQSIGSNRPVGWEISNGRSVLPNMNTYFPPVTVAHSGDYALMLGIWYNYTKDMATQTAPINFRPVVLKGHYKYTDNRVMGDTGDIDDQASARVYVLKWNETRSRRDTIGSGEILLNAASEYTEFICPIVYISTELPDSITVILDCSLMNRLGHGGVFVGGGGVASFFTVDSIELVEENLGVTQPQKMDIVVYPNPVMDVLNIKNFKGDVQIYDAVGKFVSSHDLLVAEDISVINLTSGVYHLQLNDGTKPYHKKFIKQ